MATDIKNDSNLSTNLISCFLTDSSGLTSDLHGSNTLTDNNTVTLTTGVQGDAGDFEASYTEYLSSSSSDFDVSGALSIAAWINLESISGNSVIASKHGGGGDRKFQFYVNSSGVLSFLWRNSANSSGTVGAATSTLSTGTDYHVGISFTGSAVTFYVDASSETTDSGVTGLPSSTTDFQIGAQNGGNPFDGAINQVCFWDAAKNSTTFTDLYNSGSGIPYETAGGDTFIPKTVMF